MHLYPLAYLFLSDKSEVTLLSGFTRCVTWRQSRSSVTGYFQSNWWLPERYNFTYREQRLARSALKWLRLKQLNCNKVKNSLEKWFCLRLFTSKLLCKYWEKEREREWYADINHNLTVEYVKECLFTCWRSTSFIHLLTGFCMYNWLKWWS